MSPFYIFKGHSPQTQKKEGRKAGEDVYFRLKKEKEIRNPSKKTDTL